MSEDEFVDWGEQEQHEISEEYEWVRSVEFIRVLWLLGLEDEDDYEDC